jgi:IS1 family transposase
MGHQIGGRGFNTAKKLFERLKNSWQICRFASDNYSVYRQIIPKEKHMIGKEFTQVIES